MTTIETYIALTSTYGKLALLKQICQVWHELIVIIEGRDKTVKLFQYFTKFCSWFYLKRSPAISINYFLVSGKSSNRTIADHLNVERIREARQLFRIFKSLFEFKRI